MNHHEDLVHLVKKYISGTALPGEVEELFFLLRNGEHDALIKELLAGNLSEQPTVEYDAERWEPVLQRVLAARRLSPPAASPRKITTGMRWLIAACFLISLGAGFYVWSHRQVEATIAAAPSPKPVQDVAPGKDGAILTLADGSKIVLDSLSNGSVSVQGDAKVVKSNGMLSYDLPAGAAAQAVSAQPVYNILSTPKGRQFRLILPDGTRVWLNALSSIRYPATFIENHRTVELTGEAYFEVAKNAAKPFHVLVPAHENGRQQMDVQALGTGFNINAYEDEPSVKATLIEGVVKFMAQGEEKVMEPGQQGIVSNRNPRVKLKNVDTEQVMAWKNGYFILDGTSIQAVMRQLARWYDVEVEYKGNFTGDDFAGQIPRTATLSQVLKMIELTEVVRFEIEGRKVIVSQKS